MSAPLTARALLARQRTRLGRPPAARGRRAALVSAALVAVAVSAAPGARGSAAPVATRAASAPVLLALGDSLASGYQPTDGQRPPPVDPATGFRDRGYPGGYAGDLAAARHLALVDLACPGETTASMTTTPAKPACAATYRAMLGASSQLSAATSYLARHRGTVALLTLDLGANDVDGCVSSHGISTTCLTARESEVAARLPAIVATLRASLSRDDPSARFVAMNYYDPFLGIAYSPGGLVGTLGATLSLGAIAAFDRSLDAVYSRAHVPVADVAAAFHTSSALPLLTYDGHRLPADVVYVCRWTYMCPAPHSSVPQDIHATTAGYAVIASAFEKVLGPT